MKLGGAPAAGPQPAARGGGAGAGARGGPGPRMSAMLAVQRSTLYVYGGVLEKDDKQFYLTDMYSLGKSSMCKYLLCVCINIIRSIYVVISVSF